MLTYHAPQMKYWRNMKTQSLSFRVDWSGAGMGCGVKGKCDVGACLQAIGASTRNQSPASRLLHCESIASLFHRPQFDIPIINFRAFRLKQQPAFAKRAVR